MDENKPPLEDLVHFGVLGMHWGKRKSAPSGPSNDPPRTYRTHLPTQEQLLSEHRAPIKINTSTQKSDPSKDELKKDITQLLARSALLIGAGIIVSNGPQMKVAYKTIKNSARMLRGQKAVARQGRSLLHRIGDLPAASLTPVKGSVRMIVRSLNDSRT